MEIHQSISRNALSFLVEKNIIFGEVDSCKKTMPYKSTYFL